MINSSFESNVRVSIVVPTFNQSLTKILETIDSAIKQKGIDFEIIICDDASQKTYDIELNSYFSKVGFREYKLVNSSENTGTVKNLIRGIESAAFEYVKIIGPGDLLVGETCLLDWVTAMIKHGSEWSFCDTICYTGEYPNRKAVECVSHPRAVSSYLKDNLDDIRWDYFVFENIAVGASMIGRRELFLKYLSLLSERVIYAEDNIYKMMMFEGVVGYYYPHDAILYEHGTGISTSGNSAWVEKIVKDYLAAEEIIEKRINRDDPFQVDMWNSFRRTKTRKGLLPFVKREFLYKLDRWISSRKTHLYDIEGDKFFAERTFD